MSIERMKKLVESFDNKNEVIKETKISNVSEKAIKKESERLKKIANIPNSEIVEENTTGYQRNAPPYVQGIGQTVNTFISQSEIKGMPVTKQIHYNPKFTYLQPAEALKVSIERVLNSGAPINNMSFYEEVNWNLENMGFMPKSPLDIKNAILKMLKD
jgi:hypothetical protein